MSAFRGQDNHSQKHEVIYRPIVESAKSECKTYMTSKLEAADCFCMARATALGAVALISSSSITTADTLPLKGLLFFLLRCSRRGFQGTFL